ncbi:MAG: TetR family transcriptional regulator [Deltaproteobacteria bacterium]|nr:TetR family transcriptional regulator [Deltaproteobacteria bacterium]
MADLRRSTEVRQVELTDAALHIIATRGIAALTTRSLAEQVGLSSGDIFPSLPASIDALIEAVVARGRSWCMESTFPSKELPPPRATLDRPSRRGAPRCRRPGRQLMRLSMLSEQFPPGAAGGRLGAASRHALQKTGSSCGRASREGRQRAGFAPTSTRARVVVVARHHPDARALGRQSSADRHGSAVGPDVLGVLLRPPPPVVPRSTRAKGLRGR